MATVLGSLIASGCTYVAVTPSVNGRAYVVKKKGNFLLGKSSLYNCDATNGTPTCYEVTNVANGPVSAGSSNTSASAAPVAAAEGESNE